MRPSIAKNYILRFTLYCEKIIWSTFSDFNTKHFKVTPKQKAAEYHLLAKVIYFFRNNVMSYLDLYYVEDPLPLYLL